MTWELPIYAKTVIPHLDGVRNLVFDYKLIVIFDGPKMMFKVIEPWLTEFIRVVPEGFEIAANERRLNELIFAILEVGSKSLKPKEVLAMLDGEIESLEILFKLPSTEFHFFALTSTENACTLTLKKHLKIAMVQVEENPQINLVEPFEGIKDSFDLIEPLTYN
jgi:hypothetical protein